MNIYKISKQQYTREKELEKYIKNFILQAHQHGCSEAVAAAKRILNYMYKLQRSDKETKSEFSNSDFNKVEFDQFNNHTISNRQ